MGCLSSDALFALDPLGTRKSSMATRLVGGRQVAGQRGRSEGLDENMCEGHELICTMPRLLSGLLSTFVDPGLVGIATRLLTRQDVQASS